MPQDDAHGQTLCSTIGLLGLQSGIMLLRVIYSAIWDNWLSCYCACEEHSQHSLLYHRVIGLTIWDNRVCDSGAETQLGRQSLKGFWYEHVQVVQENTVCRTLATE